MFLFPAASQLHTLINFYIKTFFRQYFGQVCNTPSHETCATLVFFFLLWRYGEFLEDGRTASCLRRGGN